MSSPRSSFIKWVKMGRDNPSLKAGSSVLIYSISEGIRRRVSQTATQSQSHIASQPPSHTVNHSATQSASQPRSHTVSHSATLPAKQSPSKPFSHTVSSQTDARSLPSTAIASATTSSHSYQHDIQQKTLIERTGSLDLKRLISSRLVRSH